MTTKRVRVLQLFPSMFFGNHALYLIEHLSLLNSLVTNTIPSVNQSIDYQTPWLWLIVNLMPFPN